MVVRRLLLAALVIAAAGMLVFGVLSLAHSVQPAPPAQPARTFASNADRPNVVFILLDALRADRVTAQRNGVPVMPHLDQFAKQSVRFTHAISQCTWTRASMASIFTSMYVDTHHVFFSAQPVDEKHRSMIGLPKSLETMATYMKKAGYTTLAVQTNGNTIPKLGFAQGFDLFDYLPREGAESLTAHAIRRLQDLKQPFFLYIHYVDVHMPYDPPEEYRKLFGWPPPISEAEIKIATDFLDYFWDHVDFKLGKKDKPDFPQLSPQGEEAVRTLYDCMARYVDDKTAPMLDWLVTNRKNTLVIVTADHGEHLWDHGYLGHGLTMYGEETNVPLIVHGPGLEPRTIDVPVETFGMLPTIAAFAGLPPNPAWQGRDYFSPEILGGQTPVFSHTQPAAWGYNVDAEMVELNGWKLILNRVAQKVELYDLTTDPLEKIDRAAERPDDVARLTRLIEDHRKRNLAARAKDAGEAVKVDPEAIKQLKELGYLRETK